MARSRDLLVIPEHFESVLSGEFSPRCDRTGQTHTLGELALATFKKGSSSGIPESEGCNISYQPSWAKDISCQIGRLLLPAGQSRLFEVTLLSYNDEDEMSFIDLEGKQLLVYETSRQKRFEFTYDYENQLDTLRDMATERAKLFLDQVAS